MKKVSIPKVGKAAKLYDPKYLVRIYRLAKDGFNNSEIAKVLGVEKTTFHTWKEKYPDVRDALDQGRQQDGLKAHASLMDHMYDRLPDDLKPVWDQIMMVDKDGAPPVERLEAMLKESGRRGRQNLFLHALVHHNYQIGKACKAVMIRRKELDRWLQDDPQFAELVEQITVHDKKDFFESALVELVKAGHPGAILFVNKTANADRGYQQTKSVKHQHDHTGTVTHGHAVVDVTKLDLPLEDRKRILQAIRENRQLSGG